MKIFRKIVWTKNKPRHTLCVPFEKSSAGSFNLYFPHESTDGKFMLWNQLTGEIKYFNRENEAKKFVENQLF